MAIHTLFDNNSSDTQDIAPLVALTGDVGRMPRDRRLALYVGACRELGLTPETRPLRFIRCNDGTLRLSIPAYDAASVRQRLASTTPLSFLRGGRPTSSDRSMLGGRVDGTEASGIAYDIDLGTGHLSVVSVVKGAMGNECEERAKRSALRGVREERAKRSALRGVREERAKRSESSAA